MKFSRVDAYFSANEESDGFYWGLYCLGEQCFFFENAVGGEKEKIFWIWGMAMSWRG